MGGIVSDMNVLNDEIKLTLDLIQADVNLSAHSELQKHLKELLEIKRARLDTETELRAELERERERRFEGNRIANAEHRDEIEYLVSALERITDLELLSTDGVTDFGISQDRWRKFCEAQEIAASAIAQYRKQPVTHDEIKPLTKEQLYYQRWAD